MAFPSTPLIDGFNRADENPLSDGGKWSLGPLDFTAGRTLRLVSNEAIATDTFFGSNSYRNDQNYGPDTEVYAKLTGSLTRVFLFARCVNIGSGSTDGYFATFHRDGILNFYRIDNASQVVLQSISPITLNTGDEVGFEIVGSTLKAYRKPPAGSWTELGSVTDSTYSAAGKIGAYCDTGGIDDFSGGTANPATRFAVTSSSYSVTAGTSVTVSAQLEDNSSNPVAMSGLTVNWSVSGGSASPTSSATNSSGIATTTFTTTTSTGNFTVSASATRIPTGVYEGNSPVIHGVPGAAVAANSTILAVPTLIDSDGISTAAITVRAIDANGNGLTSGGATVLLSTTTGTLGSVTDVGDGSYTATLTSSTIAGTALITGTLGGATIGGSATVEFHLAGVPNPAVYASRPVRSGQREVRAGVRST